MSKVKVSQEQKALQALLGKYRKKPTDKSFAAVKAFSENRHALYRTEPETVMQVMDVLAERLMKPKGVETRSITWLVSTYEFNKERGEALRKKAMSILIGKAADTDLPKDSRVSLVETAQGLRHSSYYEKSEDIDVFFGTAIEDAYKNAKSLEQAVFFGRQKIKYSTVNYPNDNGRPSRHKHYSTFIGELLPAVEAPAPDREKSPRNRTEEAIELIGDMLCMGDPLLGSYGENYPDLVVKASQAFAGHLEKGKPTKGELHAIAELQRILTGMAPA
jgi:hypothetical protein